MNEHAHKLIGYWWDDISWHLG